MATIKDIAELANVSTTTVSRVLNNDQSFSVSEATRNKVLAAAKQLEYKTVVERYTQKYYRFALVYKPIIFYSQLENDFHFSIRNGIDKICAQYGIDLFNVFNTAGGGTVDNIHGAIIQGNYSDKEIEDMVALLRTDNILIIGRSPDDNRYDSVWFDTRRAIHSALNYMTSLGHRDIGYMGWKENHDVDEDDRRDRIFQRYMAKLSGDKPPSIYVGENLRSGRSFIERALEDGPLPPAIFFANDPVAISALEYLNEQGIAVPDALSIVSLDGHQLAPHTSPALTTVKIPTEYMGRVAVQTLMEKVEEGRTLTKKVLVPTELSIRKSAKARP